VCICACVRVCVCACVYARGCDVRVRVHVCEYMRICRMCAHTPCTFEESAYCQCWVWMQRCSTRSSVLSTVLWLALTTRLVESALRFHGCRCSRDDSSTQAALRFHCSRSSCDAVKAQTAAVAASMALTVTLSSTTSRCQQEQHIECVCADDPQWYC